MPAMASCLTTKAHTWRNLCNTKITRGVAKISLGMQEKLFMGNIDSGATGVMPATTWRVMWMMLQQNEADDFVLATGVKITVREFINMAFGEVGIKLRWEGKAEKRKGIDTASGKVLVEIDQNTTVRPKLTYLLATQQSTNKKMGWIPKQRCRSFAGKWFNRTLNCLNVTNTCSKAGIKYCITKVCAWSFSDNCGLKQTKRTSELKHESRIEKYLLQATGAWWDLPCCAIFRKRIY